MGNPELFTLLENVRRYLREKSGIEYEYALNEFEEKRYPAAKEVLNRDGDTLLRDKQPIGRAVGRSLKDWAAGLPD